jgi:CubicO group peptidase (beta-lactamase class C family)
MERSAIRETFAATRLRDCAPLHPGDGTQLPRDNSNGKCYPALTNNNKEPREAARATPGLKHDREASMYRKAFGMIFALGVAATAPDGAANAQQSAAGAAIDASLRGAVERKDVPGIVALVTDRERVLYRGAFGVADVSSGRPLAPDALFRIASMTNRSPRSR